MKYTAKQIIKRSRHINYFNSLEKSLKKQILDRIDQLIKEENKYCDLGNYGHLCNIFSAIAIYELLQENGYSEKEAFDITSNEMYKYIQKTRDKFQKMSKNKWFFSIMKIIIPIGFKMGSGIGWKFKWFKNDNKNEYYFETKECIYQKIFKERNLTKLGPMFCKCDIINYGELNNIDFIRKGTLCYGDDVCDFRFVRYKDNESFIRTKSK